MNMICMENSIHIKVINLIAKRNKSESEEQNILKIYNH